MFFKKGGLRKFSKFRCFLANFAKFLRTPFYGAPLGDCFRVYRKKKEKENRKVE